MWQFLIALVVVFAIGMTIRILMQRRKKASQAPPSTPTNNAQPPRPAQGSFCPNCGTKNDANSAFCGNCGAKLK